MEFIASPKHLLDQAYSASQFTDLVSQKAWDSAPQEFDAPTMACQYKLEPGMPSVNQYLKRLDEVFNVGTIHRLPKAVLPERRRDIVRDPGKPSSWGTTITFSGNAVHTFRMQEIIAGTITPFYATESVLPTLNHNSVVIILKDDNWLVDHMVKESIPSSHTDPTAAANFPGGSPGASAVDITETMKNGNDEVTKAKIINLSERDKNIQETNFLVITLDLFFERNGMLVPPGTKYQNTVALSDTAMFTYVKNMILEFNHAHTREVYDTTTTVLKMKDLPQSRLDRMQETMGCDSKSKVYIREVHPPGELSGGGEIIEELMHESISLVRSEIRDINKEFREQVAYAAKKNEHVEEFSRTVIEKQDGPTCPRFYQRGCVLGTLPMSCENTTHDKSTFVGSYGEQTRVMTVQFAPKHEVLRVEPGNISLCMLVTFSLHFTDGRRQVGYIHDTSVPFMGTGSQLVGGEFIGHMVGSSYCELLPEMNSKLTSTHTFELSEVPRMNVDQLSISSKSFSNNSANFGMVASGTDIAPRRDRMNESHYGCLSGKIAFGDVSLKPEIKRTIAKYGLPGIYRPNPAPESSTPESTDSEPPSANHLAIGYFHGHGEIHGVDYSNENDANRKRAARAMYGDKDTAIDKFFEKVPHSEYKAMFKKLFHPACPFGVYIRDEVVGYRIDARPILKSVGVSFATAQFLPTTDACMMTFLGYNRQQCVNSLAKNVVTVEYTGIGTDPTKTSSGPNISRTPIHSIKGDLIDFIGSSGQESVSYLPKADVMLYHMVHSKNIRAASENAKHDLLN